MGAVKLQWERKYYRSCYVPRASQFLTSDTWVIVRARGMRLYTYWSAALKSHKLNKVLCIPHFFADWSSSEGLCFMLISPPKLCSTILFPSSRALFRPWLPAAHPFLLVLNRGVISGWNFGDASMCFTVDSIRRSAFYINSSLGHLTCPFNDLKGTIL